MSIRTLLSSLIGPKASAPVSRTDDPGAVDASMDALIARLRERGMISEGFKEAAPSASPAPQHPLAPEREPPELDWDRWSQMQRETFRRGWSFARFATRSAPDRMACVFGIVRGGWGIAVMDFHICGTGGSAPLNAVTHLPSGMGCGLFVDQESAASACDIAWRLADDWEVLDPSADHAATKEAIQRMHSAWDAAGITRCATHAHATADAQSEPLTIWFQNYNTVVMGRPEGKLS